VNPDRGRFLVDLSRFLDGKFPFLVEDLDHFGSSSRNKLSTAFPRRGIGPGITFSDEKNRSLDQFVVGFGSVCQTLRVVFAHPTFP